MVIFNLRGPSGAGKSTLARRLMEDYGQKPVIGERPTASKRREIVGHFIERLNLYIVGPYDGRNGPDVWKNDAHVEKKVRECARQGMNVLFEGLTITSSWERWRNVADDWPDDFWWLFVDPPLEVCVARVLKRNGGRPIDPKHIEMKKRPVKAHYERAILNAYNARQLSWVDAETYPHLLEVMKEAGIDI